MAPNRDKIWKMFGCKCAYCGCDLKSSTGKHMQVDHVRALHRNWFGSGCLAPENDREDNLFPSCPRCNNYKGSLNLKHFRFWINNSIRALEKVTAFQNAKRYGMIEIKEWDGKFWFEKWLETFGKGK